MLDTLSDETIILLNRALLVMHTTRATAHELNNVFQMISGSAELLEMNPEFPAALRHKLETIARHTGRGRSLVTGVSDLARTQPPRAPVADVNRAIEHVKQLRHFEHLRGGIELEVDVPAGGSVAILADPLDLQMMLLNLVIEGEHAVEKAATKTIALSVRRDGPMCQIAVTHSGEVAPDVKTLALVAALGADATRILAARHGGHLQRAGSASTLALQLQ